MTESLAGSLLVNYTVALDQYIKSPDAIDALEPFLTFATAIASTSRQGRQAGDAHQAADETVKACLPLPQVEAT